MNESRLKLRHLGQGLALGLLVGLVAKELDLPALVSFWGDRALLATVSMLLGGMVALTPLRPLLTIVTVASVLLWLAVAYTPLTGWMSRDLPRRDPLVAADAVFVFASAIQDDGELTTLAMSRLVHGLEVLGEGWAPRLVLSELPLPWPSYRDAACELMESLGLSQEVVTVGPVTNTHEEAVAVAALARDFGFEQIIAVTSPSHSRRASAALEAAGVSVVSSPSQQTHFDFENLGSARSDHRVRAFGFLAHEYLGLAYYRFRGWISS